MITGILLAAGAGTRFGGDKLLAVLGGQPLVLHALAALTAAADTTLAVIRPADTALREVLERAGVPVHACADAHRGMGHSLACATAAAPAAADLLVALADMPRVQPATAQAIAGALRAGTAIAVPVHAGRRGHPVGFSARLRTELLALHGDTGARAVLARHATAVLEIPVDDPGIHADVDTPEALARLARPAAR